MNYKTMLKIVLGNNCDPFFLVNVIILIALPILILGSPWGFFLLMGIPKYFSNYFLFLGVIDLIIALIVYKLQQRSSGTFVLYIAFTILYFVMGLTGIAVLHIIEGPSVSREEGIKSIKDCDVRMLTIDHYFEKNEITFESGKAPIQKDSEIYDELLEKIIAGIGILRYNESNIRRFDDSDLESFIETARSVKELCGYEIEGIEGFRKSVDI